MQNVDTIIHAKWILTVDATNTVYMNHSLIIDQGKILAIMPTDCVSDVYHGSDVHALLDHAILPGFINVHGHCGMSLLRGYADDLPLMSWLQSHIWPAEAKWVSAEFVKDGTELAILEMLSTGTTCFSDMYFFPEEIAQVANLSGMRAQVCTPIIDFPTPWAQNADEGIDKTCELLDQYTQHPRVQIAFGPHAPYTVSDAPLQEIAALSANLDVPVQIHLHETAYEVEEALKNTTLRPTQRLQSLGLLSDRTQCVHMTQINKIDIDLLTASNAHVIHCPESNLKLASGFCPVGTLLAASINVALGTDGAASNNDLDLLSEARTASLLAKAVHQDATTLNAVDTLRMLTINGARALRLDKNIGSLEVGKSADVIALNINAINQTPMYDITSHIIYASYGNQVTHAWVNGQILYDNRTFTTMNASQICETANAWGSKIQEYRNANS